MDRVFDENKTIGKIIMGLDPGYKNIGYYIIKVNDGTVYDILSGEVKTRTHEVTSNLKERKINIDLIQLDKQKRTGFSLVVVNEKNKKSRGERVIFVYKGASDNLKINTQKILSQKPDWFYITSLAGDWEKTLSGISRLVKKDKIKIAINLGADQIGSGLKKLSNILAITEILILNRDEAIELVSSRAKNKKLNNAKLDNINFLVSELLKAGPRVVVITDNKNGAYVGSYNLSPISSNGRIKNFPFKKDWRRISQGRKTHPYFSQEGKCKILFFPASSDKQVDATGAGDAFGSAFVGGYILNNGDLEIALKFGIINSGSVISKYGAENGILRRKEIERRIKKLEN